MSETNAAKKNKIFEECFSYLGNQNNPPDFIIKNGDAIEVKKIEGFTNSLALNSSYPKDSLLSADMRITDSCRACDGGKWREKDLFYTIGSVNKGALKYLFFVHGKCYAAEHNIYERVHSPIKKEVDSILGSLGLEKGETVELGKVKKVDPLGITELRIRGMWQIENPVSVFDYIVSSDKNVELSVNAIMLTEKYESFPEDNRKKLEKLVGKNFSITDVKIKSPNNPAILLKAKLLSFKK